MNELFEDVEVTLPYEKNEHNKLVKYSSKKMHKPKFNKHNDLLNQLIEQAKDKNLTGGQMGHAIIELYKHDNMIGGSFWSDLVGVISDVLPFIAPMLNVVPIIGPALSMSAYSLAPLGKIGTELYRQKEEEDYGLPSLSGIAKNAIKRVKNIGKDVVEYIEDKDKNITELKPTKSGNNVYKPTKEAPSIRKPVYHDDDDEPIDRSKPAGLGRHSKKGTKAMKNKMAHLRSLKKSGGKSRISQAIKDIKNFERPSKEDIFNEIVDTTGSLITSGITGYLDYKEDYDDKPKSDTRNSSRRSSVSSRYEPYVPPLTFDSNNDYNDHDNFVQPVEMKYPSRETSRRSSIAKPTLKPNGKYLDFDKPNLSLKPKQNKYDKQILTNKLKNYLDEKQKQLKDEKLRKDLSDTYYNWEEDKPYEPYEPSKPKKSASLDFDNPFKARFYSDPEDQDPEYTIIPRVTVNKKRVPYLRKGFNMLKDVYKSYTNKGGAKRGRPRKISNNIISSDIISASGKKHNKKNLTVSFNDF